MSKAGYPNTTGWNEYKVDCLHLHFMVKVKPDSYMSRHWDRLTPKDRNESIKKYLAKYFPDIPTSILTEEDVKKSLDDINEHASVTVLELMSQQNNHTRKKVSKWKTWFLKK